MPTERERDLNRRTIRDVDSLADIRNTVQRAERMSKCRDLCMAVAETHLQSGREASFIAAHIATGVNPAFAAAATAPIRADFLGKKEGETAYDQATLKDRDFYLRLRQQQQQALTLALNALREAEVYDIGIRPSELRDAADKGIEIRATGDVPATVACEAGSQGDRAMQLLRMMPNRHKKMRDLEQQAVELVDATLVTEAGAPAA